jgi:hypothetical protein
MSERLAKAIRAACREVKAWKPWQRSVDAFGLPDKDYSCGAAFCDDPACNLHGPKDSDGGLLYWKRRK